MTAILELREKRAKAWDAAKNFLDSKRGNDGMHDIALALMAVQAQTTDVLSDFPTKAAKETPTQES